MCSFENGTEPTNKGKLFQWHETEALLSMAKNITKGGFIHYLSRRSLTSLGFLLSVTPSLFSTLPHHNLSCRFFRKVKLSLLIFAWSKWIDIVSNREVMPTAQRPPPSEQCKPLSYIHRTKRWTKREIRSYDVKQHLFSVYLKIFLIASARSDLPN